MITSIFSDRLALIPMTPAFLEACLAGAREEASRMLGYTVPRAWLNERDLMQLRLDQMFRDPALEAWLLRAVVLRAEGVMIGHIGCHTAPEPEYLQEYAPAGVEIGYTIFAPYRRRGYASEAFGALIEWAHRERGVPQFVVSISPENEPSRRMATRFGFRKVGSHVDEEDGPEDIFVRTVGEGRLP